MPSDWSRAGSLRALTGHRLQRLVLRSANTPLRRVWALAYDAIARVSGAFFARGVPGASVYLRAGAASGELLPGMSDIDLAVVTPGASDRVRDRWASLRRYGAWAEGLVDRPLIFDEADLPLMAGSSARTFGLGDGSACYFGERPTLDWIRTLEHPGLDGPTADWRLLRGPERRPAAVAHDADEERLAAWADVLLWWRWVAIFCDQLDTPRAADVCVKLIANPARVWLRLAHGERAESRTEALLRLARRLPEEEPIAWLALDLQRRLPYSPDPPFDAVLPAFVRMTCRVDELLAARVAGAGTDEVRLAGAGPSQPLPLADWPAVAAPPAFAETFRIGPGDPGDRTALARAVGAYRPGAYEALRSGDLLVLPARPIPHTRMRAVKSRATDPVSFALAGGEAVARFPRARGWSAADLAARAVAEHGAWLRSRRVPPRPWVPPPPACHTLGMLLSAGRAALFAESLRAGDPELVVGPEEVGRRLGEDAVEAHAASAASGEPPPEAVVADLEACVAPLYD